MAQSDIVLATEASGRETDLKNARTHTLYGSLLSIQKLSHVESHRLPYIS